MMIRLTNVVMFALMVFMNYLANALPLNGKTTGELSAQFPNLFVPAGITFSIWGIIYLLLLGFVIFQFSGQNKIAANSIGWAFAISCLLNGLWIVAWHYEKLPISLIIMLGLLAALIYINIQLANTSAGFAKAAFGVYLGWVSIATIANATALLVNYKWGAWGISPEAWAIIMIGAGAIITGIAVMRLRNPFMGIAVLWAFAGIIINRRQDFISIVIAAAVAIVIVGVVLMMVSFRKT
jgi:tryptophan-rich sensory protein